MYITQCVMDDPKDLPFWWSTTRKIWKLTHRYRRLCVRADKVRGTCMNKAWLEVADHIYQTLDKLKELGVDVEKLE